MNVIITGGTSGIGYLLAQKFSVEKNAKVIITGRKKNFEVKGKNIIYVEANQARPKLATEKILRAIKKLKWKKINYVFLNGAIGKVGNPFNESANDIEEQINVNLFSNILFANELAKFLFAANGALIFIGSTAHKGNGSFATYAATKAGLHSLARSLIEEWHGRARVQIIHLGATKTNMHEKAGLKLGAIKNFFAPPEKMARAIKRVSRKKSGIYKVSTLRAWFAL